MAEHSAPDAGLVERWQELSPVRLALYPVVVAVVALFVGYGLIADERAPLWLAVAAAVLGTLGTETARRGAYSPATVRAVTGEWDDYASQQYARGCADALHTTPDLLADRCRDVRGGARCELPGGHEGGHLIRTD